MIKSYGIEYFIFKKFKEQQKQQEKSLLLFFVILSTTSSKTKLMITANMDFSYLVIIESTVISS